MLTEMGNFREKGWKNCHVLADRHKEMLLKTVGKPLGTARRVKENRWKMTRLLESLCAIL
jgi:hypothetical protein